MLWVFHNRLPVCFSLKSPFPSSIGVVVVNRGSEGFRINACFLSNFFDGVADETEVGLALFHP